METVMFLTWRALRRHVIWAAKLRLLHCCFQYCTGLTSLQRGKFLVVRRTCRWFLL